MSHTISLSLHPDLTNLGREEKVKDQGYQEKGGELYGSDNVFVLVFP